jgi:hypothetical protein
LEIQNSNLLKDDLISINLTEKDIYDQLNGYDVNFIKYKNDFVENKKNIPLFTKSFYEFIFTYNRIPSQDELHLYYMDNYKKILPYTVNNYSDEILFGFKARIFRLYPSLIRDLHFYLYLKENLKNCKIYYNFSLDSTCAIDILVEYNEIYYGLKLCTDTVSSIKYLIEKRDERKIIVYENVIPIVFLINLKDDRKIIQTLGEKVVLYNVSHLNRLKYIFNNKMKLYKNKITTISKNQIFIFGSNTDGRHGKGAAKFALDYCGAKYGNPQGLQGNSYAIITKDLKSKIQPSITQDYIKAQIKTLYNFAKTKNYEFIIPYSANSENLNGYTPQEMADMFSAYPIPINIKFEYDFFKLMKKYYC